VAVCHEVTPEVAARVPAQRLDLLVSYHPLLFRPVRALVAGSGPGGRAWRLADSGTALACLHTAFDVAPGGASDALAESLALEDVVGFGPLYGAQHVKVATFAPAEQIDAILDAVVEAGAARIGRYSHCSFRTEGTGTFFAGEGSDPVTGQRGVLNREAEQRVEFVAPRACEDAVIAALVRTHPYEEPAYDVYDRRGDAALLGRVGVLSEPLALRELAARVRAALSAPGLRSAGDPDRRVTRVAVVPGSGGDYAQAARAAGAEVLVTGDAGHHAARAALERGLAWIDPGHAASERPGLARLGEWVRDLDPDAWVALDAPDPEPWWT